MNAAVLSIDDLIQQELPAARSGDQGAYGRIVAACQNTVTAVALAITRDVSASEDIAQEAFLNAWQHLERLHSPDSFLPWLRQITRNLARDHLRAHRNQPLDGPNAELVMAMAADPGPQPMQKMLEDERESAAFELISSLPDDSREALLLFYREGQSSQQVAMLLGISDAAARKRLSRARQLVRDDILKRFGDFARSSAPSAAFTAAIITALGMASKPAAAAGATAIGTATLGGALAGKGLAGIVGMGSVIGGSLVSGAIAAHLTRRYLLVFADTLEERDAILPIDLVGEGPVVAMAVEASAGEYRAGDQLWLRQTGPEDFAKLLNRDVLAPRPAGRFAFGRMIDRQGSRIALLPPGPGQRQVVIDSPAWVAAAEMLVRKL